MAYRKIIHIDMDAFFVSVEEHDNPALKGHPVVVGYDGPRGVVSTASYEARRFGVHSAMSIAKAKQMCRDLIIVPSRFEAYKDVSRQIHGIFHRYTDIIEPISLDEAFAGVDDSNISEMFGLLEKLGFGYIMNSQALWGCYETVPSLEIAELFHEKDSGVITVILYEWNGKRKILEE